MPALESGKDIPYRLTGSRAVFVYSLIGGLFALLMLSIGIGGPVIDRALIALLVTLESGWIPLLYLAGAMGLARIARGWTHGLASRSIIELGIGLTITLSLSHGLGVLGYLNPISAWIITGTGCLLLGIDLRKHASRFNYTIGHTTITIPGIAFVIGCVLVVIMSLNPPGALWDSEFGGYDALSYHLELPREWLEAGRIWPSEHNVYSFLPGYFESAYVHFAYLDGAPKTTADGLSGFLANDARVAMSTQLFSALLVIISAWAMRMVTRRAIELYLPLADHHDRHPALCARVLMTCTPWIVVVGSLAYNEMGVVFLGICALAVAIEREAPIGPRVMMSALIVAGASSVKPTALFLLAPSVAVVLLSTIPIRQWIKLIVLGSLVGLLTLSPWLIRNELATANIVFPHLASTLGEGHWTNAQHAIYSDAHRFNGSILDRFTMLIMPDPEGAHHVSRFRGFTNLQWAITPWVGLIGFVILIARKRTRRLGALIGLTIALPIVGWIALTHLQSRFLIPLTPMLIGVGVMGLAAIRVDDIRHRLINAFSLVACAWTILIAARQSSGNPFAVIDLGTGVYTGEIEINDPPWTATLNESLDPDETVYLIADATPFYVRSPTIYNTVYDRWLIEDAIDAYPDNPRMWTSVLLDRGIDAVVIGFSEIDRFAGSGWLPDSIDTDQLIEWIDSLGEPIQVWTLPGGRQPIRAIFRLQR